MTITKEISTYVQIAMRYTQQAQKTEHAYRAVQDARMNLLKDVCTPEELATLNAAEDILRRVNRDSGTFEIRDYIENNL